MQVPWFSEPDYTSATDLLSPLILIAIRTLYNSCPAIGIPIGLQVGLSVSSPSDSLENRDEGGYQAPSYTLKH